LKAQSYTSRSIILFKQITAVIKEKGRLFEETIEIINELLTTLIYKTFLIISERKVAIVVDILIQYTKGF